MGLSMAKPRYDAKAKRKSEPRRTRHECQRYECGLRSGSDEYWDNTMLSVIRDCRNTDDSGRPECRALLRDPRFSRVFQGRVTKTQYLKYVTQGSKCRLGDHFSKNQSCRALLKTVHPAFARRKEWH